MKNLVGLFFFVLPFCVFSQEAFVGAERIASNGFAVKTNNFSTFPIFKSVPDLEELAEMTSGSYSRHPEYGTVPYRTQCKDCIELLDHRTEDSRYFVKSGTNGQTFYVQQIYGKLHYEDSQGWLRTVDPRIRPLGSDGLYGAPDQPRPTSYDHISGYSKIYSPTGDLKYNGLTRLLSYNDSGQITDLGQLNHQNMMVGEDGVKTLEAWTGIDREQIFTEGAIKTNFILKAAPTLPADAKWLVFEDRIQLPAGNQLVRDHFGGAQTTEGWWMGDLLINDADGNENFRIKRAIMTDANPSKYGRVDLLDDLTATYIAYDYHIEDEAVILSVRVNVDWLNHPGRTYPVTIDPLVSGSSTFSSGDRGMRFDATCWNDVNYCSHNLNVAVPGNSTLTDVFLDAQYNSEGWGCGIFVDCWMSEAAFRVVGPCGNSPVAPSYWTCPSPTGDSPGTCSGAGVPAFQMVSCIPPQCASYSLDFEMRTYFCFCSSSGCPTFCQYMPSNSWVMTVEARTIESLATANGTPVTYNGSCMVSQTLNANPDFGVPPYTYSWSEGPSMNSLTQSVTHSLNGTYPYFCTVTDACGQTSVSSVNVVINDCPLAVELADFTGKAVGEYNVLTWKTIAEVQHDYFVVERKKEGESFMPLDEVKGGNDSTGSDYEYLDRWPFNTEVQYRLKIVDREGLASYSEVVRLKRERQGDRLLISYMREGSLVHLSWDAQISDNGEVSLYSIAGQEVERIEFREEAGSQMEIELSTQELSAGTYFLRWKGQIHKILVM